MSKLLPVDMPEIGRPVNAVIKNSHKWMFVTNAVLIAVDEDDVSWRFKNDNCELSYDWDVIYWEYAPTNTND